MLTEFIASTRIAARGLLRSPGYSFTVLATIALGIAANLIVFAAADAVLLKKLPYRDPDALYLITGVHPGPDGKPQAFGLTELELLRFQARARAFRAIGALQGQSGSLMINGEPTTIGEGKVTANLFAVLGVVPEHGRTFDASDDLPHNAPVVISHELLRTRFGGNSSIIGSTLVLDGEQHVVIGVMPEGFRPLDQPSELWIPLGVTEGTLHQPVTTRSLYAVGRARAGATRTAIESDLRELSVAIARERPNLYTGWGSRAQSLHEQLSAAGRPTILALVVLVGFFLLLVCANVTNLVIARLSARQDETSLRLALGAGDWRVLELPLIEILLLTASGGAAGLLLTWLSLRPLALLAGDSTPLLHRIGMDVRLFFAGVAVTLLVVVLCATLSVVHTRRGARANTLIGRARAVTSSRQEQRVRRALSCVQIAVALVLAVGASSTVWTLAALSRVNPGFEPAGLTAVDLTLPSVRYHDQAARARFSAALLERVRRIPGVKDASAVTTSFVAGQSFQTSLTVDGQPADASSASIAQFRRVDSRYFETMRIPVIRGRALDDHDRAGAAPVAVVSKDFADRYWPGQDPLGRTIQRTAAGAQPMTVVGVVDSVRDAGLSNALGPTLYVPYSQAIPSPVPMLTLVVRSAADHPLPAKAYRAALYEIDPLLPIDAVAPISARIDDSLAAERFRSLLLSLFAVLGLLLAAVGIYGMTSYALAQRSRELSVRVALGASPHDVVRMLVLESARLTFAGLGLGLITTILLAIATRALLAGAITVNPVLYAGVSLFIAAVVAAAIAVPALRVGRISPAAVLRG